MAPSTHPGVMNTVSNSVGARRRVEAKVVAESIITNDWGRFRHLLFKVDNDPTVHNTLILGDIAQSNASVRMHSECLTGDVFGSRRCDCGEQLRMAFADIADAGHGVIIYQRGHEGRGGGLAKKLKAYAFQENGYDTVDANIALGLPVYSRSYRAAASILGAMNIRAAQLLTNNRDKVAALKTDGISCVPVPMRAVSDRENEHYLGTKVVRMGHDGLISTSDLTRGGFTTPKDEMRKPCH
jgi:GTP cyclohydrolase II